MGWVDIFVVFAVSHLVGDFVLQTNWQAIHKHGGLMRDNSVGRSALLRHGASYTLAFVPCLIWLHGELAWGIVGVAAGVAIPHVLQDDGRLLAIYMHRVKGAEPKELPIVALALDQTLHLVALLLLALITHAVT